MTNPNQWYGLNVYLVFDCDGWGHSFLRHCAATQDDAVSWCKANGAIGELEEGAFRGWPCMRCRSGFFEIRCVPVGGDYITK